MTETLPLRPLLRAILLVALLAAPMLIVSKMNAGGRMTIDTPVQHRTGVAPAF
jgi:hypothetical protein